MESEVMFGDCAIVDTQDVADLVSAKVELSICIDGNVTFSVVMIGAMEDQVGHWRIARGRARHHVERSCARKTFERCCKIDAQLWIADVLRDL